MHAGKWRKATVDSINLGYIFAFPNARIIINDGRHYHEAEEERLSGILSSSHL